MSQAGKRAVIAVVLGFALGSAVIAQAGEGDNKCDRCGVESCCLKRVCRAVPVEIETKETCYDCKCEDFCVPGPSIKCDTRWHQDDCGCWVENTWKPTCAEVRTRSLLVRKEVTRKKQGFKWEAQRLCPACECLPPAAKGTPPSGTAPEGEEIEEVQPVDQSVEEAELSTLPPRWLPNLRQVRGDTAPKRSLWSLFR